MCWVLFWYAHNKNTLTWYAPIGDISSERALFMWKWEEVIIAIRFNSWKFKIKTNNYTIIDFVKSELNKTWFLFGYVEATRTYFSSKLILKLKLIWRMKSQTYKFTGGIAFDGFNSDVLGSGTKQAISHVIFLSWHVTLKKFNIYHPSTICMAYIFSSHSHKNITH